MSFEAGDAGIETGQDPNRGSSDSGEQDTIDPALYALGQRYAGGIILDYEGRRIRATHPDIDFYNPAVQAGANAKLSREEHDLSF